MQLNLRRNCNPEFPPPPPEKRTASCRVYYWLDHYDNTLMTIDIIHSCSRKTQIMSNYVRVQLGGEVSTHPCTLHIFGSFHVRITHLAKYETINSSSSSFFFFFGGGGKLNNLGGEASPPPPLDRTLYVHIWPFGWTIH